MTSENEPADLEPRIIDLIDGEVGPGAPVLICVGGLHGNEPGGVHALERVTRRLRNQDREIQLGGTLLALRGNRAALAHKLRFLDVDLNRAWAVEDLERVRLQSAAADGPTDAEVRDLLLHIEKPLNQGRPVFLLDLHSTSGGGPPFSVVLGGKPSEKLASRIGVPCVHGLNESIQGTLTSWFAAYKGPSIVVEGGESRTEETIRHLEAAVWSSLAVAGLLPENHQRVVEARQFLAHSTDDKPSHVRVCHREKIKGMQFHMASPGGRRFKGFDFVKKDSHLAHKKNGPVLATQDGFLIMPLYQHKGSEGFFLAEPCADPALE
ncbi:MAG: succinylglutamate desuccinylase/aspartoacylase family protein [Planctomycetota bacterium]|nr:succinylglutamate desuccinylase/aspartoacylase family protein [Planctomycetota bacterium]